MPLAIRDPHVWKAVGSNAEATRLTAAPAIAVAFGSGMKVGGQHARTAPDPHLPGRGEPAYAHTGNSSRGILSHPGKNAREVAQRGIAAALEALGTLVNLAMR